MQRTKQQTLLHEVAGAAELDTLIGNTPADGPNDLRDLNGDMMIDALDARVLVTLCTRPRCATQ